MSNKKRGGRDKHRENRISYIGNNVDDNVHVNIDTLAQEQENAMLIRVADAYRDFLDDNVSPRVINVQRYWRDIRNAAYIHLKRWLETEYELRDNRVGIDFTDLQRDFLTEFYAHVNYQAHMGNDFTAYPGELIMNHYSRDLHTAFENYRLYLDHLKEESDNVEFDGTSMIFRLGRGEPMLDVARSEILYEGDLLINILDEIEVMLDYEKNEYVFNVFSFDGPNLNNFSDEMVNGDNIIETLEDWSRHGDLLNWDTLEMANLLQEYYTILENMLANTMDRIRTTYYDADDATMMTGGKKRKDKKKKKVKRKSVKKTKKHKRKTKRKVYGRKR